MAYNDFKVQTRRTQIQVWQKSRTIKNVLQSLDELSFLRDRQHIRHLLNNLCSHGSFALAMFGVAGPSLRFQKGAICYNMSHPAYLEIVANLYRALDVDLQKCHKTCICENSYELALERYTTNLIQLKKCIHAGIGCYDQYEFEKEFCLVWT